MRKDQVDIEYPDGEMIEKEIETIVMAGMRPKESFYSQLKKMYKQLGIKYLFRDMTEVVFAVLITMSILTLIGFTAEGYFSVNNGNVYTFIFISSPILYLVICLFSYLKLQQNHTYELEMTFKYNVYQLAAFRMLVFSIICLGLNAGFIFVLTASYPELNFLLAFMISATSLFLFSTVSLFLMMRIRSNLTKYFFTTGWVLVNLLLLAYSKEVYQLWIKHIPIYVYIVLTVACIAVYLKNLKKLTTFTRSKGVV